VTTYTLALQGGPVVPPDQTIAAAYYLRGWATYLTDPATRSALADVQQAVAKAPGDTLFTASLAYLRAQFPRPTVTPTRVIPPTPMPATAPIPTVRERVSFPQGGTVLMLTPLLTQSVPRGYMMYLLADQRLFVHAPGTTPVWLLNNADRTIGPVSRANGAIEFRIPRAGDYTVVLSGAG
jgi:hypothetical protein